MSDSDVHETVVELTTGSISSQSDSTNDQASRPMTLTFDKITYTVVSSKPPSTTTEGDATAKSSVFGKKQKHYIELLSNVSGCARPGEMLAIMGPSGSGKSTLLDILAHRKGDSESLQGEIKINGVPSVKSRHQSNFSRGVGYVTQDDIFIETLTLRETLLIAASLKLSESLSKSEKQTIVDNLIDELGLTKAKNTKVGGPLIPGISGGEKRRLNIAIELLSSPGILLLDEPTSGLSASDALTVIGTLKRLAEKGRTVVVTIHQPRSEIFSTFDQLLLLQKGKVAYFGAANQVPTYFKKFGFKCPFGFNLADFILDLVSVDPTHTNADLAEVVAKYNQSATNPKPVDYAKEFALINSTEKKTSPTVDLTHSIDTNPQPTTRRAFAASFGLQLRVLLYRNFLHILRHPAIFWGQLIIHILFAIISGSLFSGIKNSPSTSSVEFDIGTLLFWLSTFCAIMTFSAVPESIGAISPNVDIGMALVALCNTYNFLFSGFLVSKAKLPAGWSWGWWSAHFQWGFSALALNQWGTVTPDDPFQAVKNVETLKSFGLLHDPRNRK
ncbi:hypothetical protein HDU76_001984 [Blyttiomyces sp. JEL0837]|nr:hypothetical protein HDU76_001984 [Blyttiomyces sp. JEL0837]